MAYGIINKDGKVLLVTSKFNERTGNSIEIKQKLTVKQARAFACAIYAYCRIAEKEKKE